MEDVISLEASRSQRLQEFNLIVKALLSHEERIILYKVLKDYQRRRDIQRLVHGLKLVFQTNRKVELLKYVRYFLDEQHILEFDRLTHFHSKFRPRRQRRRRRQRFHDGKTKSKRRRDRMSVSNVSTGTTSTRSHRDVRVFTLQRDPEEPSLGFSVRGGSEHGLGLYISDIDEGSVAERSGLAVGDKLLEVNNISVKGAASSSAVKVLTGASLLKLVVQRTHKVPEWRLSKEKTSWFDVHDRKLVAGEFEECGLTHFIRGLDVDVPERRVNLKFGRNDKTLGFNVRGGKEYGLGIYISKVDKNGLADKNGVRVGDHIIDVNGVPFDNISHVHAVEILKDKRHLILTLRDVGRFPAYKELYAEYTWSSGQVRAATSLTHLTDSHLIPSQQMNARSVSSTDLFTNRQHGGIQPEIFLPATKSNRVKNGDDIQSDDSDSLLDFEKLANEIYDGEDNEGYYSDEEAHKDVIVHVQDTQKLENANIYLRKRTISQNSINSDLNEYDHADQSQKKTSRSNSETPDLLYAKIDKTQRASSSSETLAERRTSNINENITERRKSGVSEPQSERRKSTFSETGSERRKSTISEPQTEQRKNIISETRAEIRRSSHVSKNRTGRRSSSISDNHSENKDTDTESESDSSDSARKGEYNLSTRQKFKIYSKPNKSALHSQRNSIHQIDNDPVLSDSVYLRQSSVADLEAQIKPVKVEGALYSQIRRLSAASLSHMSVASQENVTKSKSRENLQKETFQVRKASLSHNSLAYSQENLDRSSSKENFHSDATLQIRTPDRIYSDNFEIHKDVSKSLESVHSNVTLPMRKAEATNSDNTDIRRESRVDIEASINNPYDMFADNDSEIIVSEEINDPNFAMHDISDRINDLEHRKMTLGFQELNMLDGSPYDEEGARDRKSIDHKNTKWTKFKDKVKGSLRMKTAKRNSLKTTDDGSTRKRGLFEKGFGGHVTHQNTVDGYNIAVMEDATRQSLNDEESDAVIRHIKMYHQDHGLQRLVEKLLAILDKPEKLLLLKDIRGVIYPTDMVKFDNMVNRYEAEAYEKLPNDDGRKPRRHLITTELAPGTSDEEIITIESTDPGEGEKGHFYLKPLGDPKISEVVVKIIGDTEASTSIDESPRRRSSRGATAVRSITDQFDYLETSEYGETSKIINGRGSFDSVEDMNVGITIVHLSKNKAKLGLNLHEQSKSDGSRILLVDSIEPGSAADDDSVLQAGMALLSVDGRNVAGCTVDEAKKVINTSYLDKQHVSMKLEVLPMERSTTM